MYIKQLSVFVENKFGRLTEVLETISDINISALSIADTTEFGILRLIVTDPEKAELALEKSGVVVKTTDVIAFEIPDTQGSLAKIMRILTEQDISVAYMYAFSSRNGHGAIDVVKTDNPEKTVEILKAEGVALLTQEEIAQL